MARRSRSKALPPKPTWTCPHCQHVHTPATLRRLDSQRLRLFYCYPIDCHNIASASTWPPVGLFNLSSATQRWPSTPASPLRFTQPVTTSSPGGASPEKPHPVRSAGFRPHPTTPPRPQIGKTGADYRTLSSHELSRLAAC